MKPAQNHEQKQNTDQELNLQHLGKQFMSNLKQDICEKVDPIRDAAAECFKEFGDRCLKFVGFMVAHKEGNGAIANNQAFEGFKKNITGAFEKCEEWITKMQKAIQKHEMKSLEEKQSAKVRSIVNKLEHETLKVQGDRITKQMKVKLNSACEEASKKAVEHNGIFTKEIRDDLKKEITKIVKEATSEAWGLRGSDVFRERAFALRNRVKGTFPLDEDNKIVLQAIKSNWMRYKNQQSGAEELNKNALRIAGGAAKNMEEEVGRLMKVLERIDNLNVAAEGINDKGVEDLVRETRETLPEKYKNSYFSHEDFNKMQKTLDEARVRIMKFQVRGKIVEGLEGLVKKVQLTENELKEPVLETTGDEQPVSK